MRAAFYTEYGGPEVCRIGEQPVPKVGPAEVLVRVRSAGLNPVDWKVMAGGLDSLMDAVFPVVPGWDVAGVVEAVGFDTPEVRVGDEVVAYARKDIVHGGTFAELVTVPVRAVARKPAGLDWDAAGALPLAGLTALRTLTRLGVRDGETVLVHAAAGGVGSLAVQVGRALGARVLGTASQTHHDFVAGLGAEPIAYGDGVVERVRALAPNGVDAVADFVGGVLDVTRAVLRDGGRHASVADREAASAAGAYVWVRPDAAGLARLGEWADAGRLTVPVSEVFSLADVAEAFRRSMSGHTRGKIAIRVSDPG